MSTIDPLEEYDQDSRIETKEELEDVLDALEEYDQDSGIETKEELEEAIMAVGESPSLVLVINGTKLLIQLC